MKRKRFSVEKIVSAVHQHEAGITVTDTCRTLGMAEATFYRWKKDYGRLDPSQVRELKQLREENERLKKLVAILVTTRPCCRISIHESGRRIATSGRGAPLEIMLQG